MTHKIDGCIFTKDGWVDGTVQFDHSVRSVDGHKTNPDDDNGDVFIIPGFIDLHVHGGGGCDVMDGQNATQVMMDYHATQGTVAMTPTTMTAPVADIEKALAGVRAVMDNASPQSTKSVSPEILGVHLEGPFISPDKLGAQPAHAIEANVETFKHWHSICPIAVMTVAPEINGARELAKYAHENHGTRVQIGHTTADYHCCKSALSGDNGDGNHNKGGTFSGATHLYNAMSGLTHRDSGAVAGILSHADYAEIILDKYHVDRGAVNTARRAIPYLYSVTDATSATGQPDGEYKLGEHTVHKKDGTVKLADGTLAGSCATMAQSFKNWLEWGDDISEAVKRTSTYPAHYMGITEQYGYVDVGSSGSLLVVNGRGDIQQVYIKGNPIL